LPSIGSTGRSTPVAAAAFARNARSPSAKQALKRARSQRHQDATKDVLARDPVRQGQRLPEELLFQVGPLGDGGGTVGAGQDGHQRDDDHTDQGVLQIDGGARVFQRLEIRKDLIQTDPLKIRHRSTLGAWSERKPHRG
jgi:hypothetical protein